MHVSGLPATHLTHRHQAALWLLLEGLRSERQLMRVVADRRSYSSVDPERSSSLSPPWAAQGSGFTLISRLERRSRFGIK